MENSYGCLKPNTTIRQRNMFIGVLKSVNTLENKSNRWTTQNKQTDCTNIWQKQTHQNTAWHRVAGSYGVAITVKKEYGFSVTPMCCHESVQLKTNKRSHILYFQITTNVQPWKHKTFLDKRSILDGNKYSYLDEDNKTWLDIKRLLRFFFCFFDKTQPKRG